MRRVRVELQGAIAVVDEMLASPVARHIQDFLGARRTSRRQLDAIVDFFDFVHAVAAPVPGWWQQVGPPSSGRWTAGRHRGHLWRHIAAALGLDPTSIRSRRCSRGIQRLWNAVVSGRQPLVQALRAAWRWLPDESLLAPLFDLFARLPQLWTGLNDLREQDRRARATGWPGGRPLRALLPR